MQILIDIARSSDGRLTGTARPADSASEGCRFAGVMELVACLERLCTAASHHGMPSASEQEFYPQTSPAPAASQQLSREGKQHG